MAFREDESRIREGYAAENMNVMMHMALNMLKSEKTLKRCICQPKSEPNYNRKVNH